MKDENKIKKQRVVKKRAKTRHPSAGGKQATKRVLPEEGLCGKKDMAKLYLDVAGVAILVLNRLGGIELINKKGCDILGYKEHEIIGKNWFHHFVPERLRDEVYSVYLKLMSGEIAPVERFENPVLTRSGQEKIIAWHNTVITDEKGAIICTLSSGEDVTAHKRTEEMLVQAKNEWEETFDTINDAITVHDRDYNIIRANKAALELLSLPDFRFPVGKCFELYHGSGCPPEGCPSCEVLKTGRPIVVDMFEPHLDRFLEIKALPRLDKDGRVTGLVHIVRDITERVRAEEEQKKLQAQFLQAQKMESIGRLAGGIAHDFRNLLTGIIGFSDLTLLELPENHPLRETFETIRDAGEKAAALTAQLLAFSRKQVLEMKTVDLNNVIGDIAKMITRIIGTDIALNLNTKKPVRSVMADPGQIEQVLMNLVVNARDAMPVGGSIIIETADVEFGEEETRTHEGAKAGNYVMLSISDTGMGMSKEIRERIFEPFFTTKELGKGTGLGLASAYGIVKQHNGYIYVYSEPDEGTTFKIYFPAVESVAVKADRKKAVRLPAGTETILVVDDDSTNRLLVQRILEPLGYRLIIAGGVEEALSVSDNFEEKIDALLTDILMPVMNGMELAGRIRAQRPGITVIFISGYTPEALARHRTIDEDSIMIEKPLRASDLAYKVREALDRK